MSQTPVSKRIERELRKRKVAKLFQTAEKYGVIKRGWSCIDYMLDSVKNMGWESTCISGLKGSAKSNLMLQHGKAIYGTLEVAKKYVVTQPKQLLDHMQDAINKERRIAWIGVDDIAALFPKSLYFTHRKLYSKLQATWETVRTVMNNFEFSCTLKNKVASFILADITGDIKCYNRIGEIKSHYDYRRWMWLRNLKDPTTDIPKLISVEEIPFPLTPDSFKIDKVLSDGKFYVGGKEYVGKEFFLHRACLTGLTRPEFNSYWMDRLSITKESFAEFKEIFEVPQPKGSVASADADEEEVHVHKPGEALTPHEFAMRGVRARKKLKKENAELRARLAKLEAENP